MIGQAAVWHADPVNKQEHERVIKIVMTFPVKQKHGAAKILSVNQVKNFIKFKISYRRIIECWTGPVGSLFGQDLLNIDQNFSNFEQYFLDYHSKTHSSMGEVLLNPFLFGITSHPLSVFFVPKRQKLILDKRVFNKKVDLIGFCCRGSQNPWSWLSKSNICSLSTGGIWRLE